MQELAFNFLSQGLGIGLAVAAPVGPISILCIQRTIKKGFLSGFVSAFGAAFGDVLFASFGTFSLTLIVPYLVNQTIWLSAVSGLLLCYLGVKTFLDKPLIFCHNHELNLAIVDHKNDFLKDYLTIVLIDLVNPMTILPFIAAFAGLYTTYLEITLFSRICFVFGVFISGFCWRIFLIVMAHCLRENLSIQQLKWINWLSGITIISFGIVAFAAIETSF